MDCPTTASMQILWNGIPTTEFKMRQGVSDDIFLFAEASPDQLGVVSRVRN